jgi:hypothetical protein
MSDLSFHSIASARVLNNFTMELKFTDGFVGQIDLKPQLWGPVFEPLTNPKYFGQFRLEDGTIRWPNGADFCPDVLRYWCAAGGVQSQQETDQYFVKKLTEQREQEAQTSPAL